MFQAADGEAAWIMGFLNLHLKREKDVYVFVLICIPMCACVDVCEYTCVCVDVYVHM